MSAIRKSVVAGFWGILVAVTAALPAVAAEPVLTMATTTSTQDTGFLEYLAPLFKKATGIELRWTATGTGKALKLGQNCDVDVLMVHAPPAEKAFVDQGFGVDRREIMYNDFVIVGPKSDPVGIRGKGAAAALRAVREKKAPFASRGDESGTHQTELSIWKGAGMPAPEKESWYIQAGQGMMATLTVATERAAYTLADRGTYIRYEANHQGRPPLVVLVEGDPFLINQYSVITVNPEKCPRVKHDPARRFADWISGPEGQKAIAAFAVEGKKLFFPNAKK